MVGWPKTQICDAVCEWTEMTPCRATLRWLYFSKVHERCACVCCTLVKSFYWSSEDGAFPLRSYMKLEEVVFLPVPKTSRPWTTVDPVNSLGYRPVAGRARAPLAYCDFSCFMFFFRFTSPRDRAGLGNVSSGESWLVWVVVIFSGLVSSGLNLNASQLGLG